jgi:hypothetical protein
MAINRLLLALALLGAVLIYSAGYHLEGFEAGAIGDTVLKGIDAGARNRYYLGGLLLAFAVLASLPALANYRFVPLRGGSRAALWQGLLLANIVLYCLYGDAVFGQAILQLALLALLARWYPSQFMPAAIVSYQLLLFAAVFLFPDILSPSLRLLLLPLLYVDVL